VTGCLVVGAGLAGVTLGAVIWSALARSSLEGACTVVRVVLAGVRVRVAVARSIVRGAFPRLLASWLVIEVKGGRWWEPVTRRGRLGLRSCTTWR
jgi:hypothetical protein